MHLIGQIVHSGSIPSVAIVFFKIVSKSNENIKILVTASISNMSANSTLKVVIHVCVGAAG
jgi:hypothetical protein